MLPDDLLALLQQSLFASRHDLAAINESARAMRAMEADIAQKMRERLKWGDCGRSPESASAGVYMLQPGVEVAHA